MKNKSQIEVPDKAENRTRLRTDRTETKKQKQREIGRNRRPRITTLKRDCYQVWRANLLATRV